MANSVTTLPPARRWSRSTAWPEAKPKPRRSAQLEERWAQGVEEEIRPNNREHGTGGAAPCARTTTPMRWTSAACSRDVRLLARRRSAAATATLPRCDCSTNRPMMPAPRPRHRRHHDDEPIRRRGHAPISSFWGWFQAGHHRRQAGARPTSKRLDQGPASLRPRRRGALLQPDVIFATSRGLLAPGALRSPLTNHRRSASTGGYADDVYDSASADVLMVTSGDASRRALNSVRQVRAEVSSWFRSRSN